ncbi:PPC domain-containing DNA-binding protein [Alkalihalobacillus sp. BA299]|uniref:PPC domain-containing DNA-binding protein n=1 Tax=Alkalihalobacillus sp. BA299 TaxID=2815938 RepID=UPI001ADAB0FD|nr:PPC domain-containing DNA-binding protein [Alkalihalobacillus sp. BA299]
MMKTLTNHSIYDEENGIIFGSLTMGTDLMEGIIQEYERYNIHSGVVTCMGSLSQATYVYIKNDQHGDLSYSDEIIEEGPIELLNGTGFLCKNENGKTDFHLHAMFGNQKGAVFGGHILPGKNPTLITIEFTIKVGKGIQALRTFKPQLGFQTITFSNANKGIKLISGDYK